VTCGILQELTSRFFSKVNLKVLARSHKSHLLDTGVATVGHLRQMPQLKIIKMPFFVIIFHKFCPKLKKIEILPHQFCNPSYATDQKSYKTKTYFSKILPKRRHLVGLVLWY
jgi:hypothetical protein